MLSKGQIRIIHVARQQLGLTDEEYREALELYGDARSSTGLSPGGFFNLMEYFRELGFGGKGGDVFTPNKKVKSPGVVVEMVTPGQRAFIRRLEADLGWADNPDRLQNFIIKRFKTKKIRTKPQASNIIEALKAILAREQDESGEHIGGKGQGSGAPEGAPAKG